MDKKINELDEFLKRGTGKTSTNFTSISNELSGKIKTFGIGDHEFDEHYKAIFPTGVHSGRRELTIHSDVKTWHPQANSSIQPVEEDIADDCNDEEEATEEELPNLSNGKKRDKPDSEDQSKKAKLLHPSADDENQYK